MCPGDQWTAALTRPAAGAGRYGLL